MNLKINRGQFVARLADNSGFTKVDAEKALSAFIKSVEDIMKEGDSVSLVGFGEFYGAIQKGKSGKVPGTDKTYSTEDKRVPKFKPGKAFKTLMLSSKK